jgi:hypothetical protein
VTEWQGIVEVQYGTIILADGVAASAGLHDPGGFQRLWEDHCGTLEQGIQVLVPERDDDVPTHVRLLEAPGPMEPEWEHVAEVRFRVPTGRLVIFSWMVDEDLAGEIDVPTESLVARIHWGGLEAWLADRSYRATGGPGPVRVRIDLVPGELDGVRTLREWHLWAPPVHESTGPDGLRVYRGAGAEKRREGLEPLPIRFWDPYPTIDEGRVTSMWRDPADGSRWADGSGGPWSHKFLRELSPAEADALEAQGFPQVYTYARDTEGRIWSADQMPLERAPALLLIPADRWAMLQGFMPADQIQVVDLPDGWSRITRRPRDHAGKAVLVDGPIGDGHDGFYQRWPDGGEIFN